MLKKRISELERENIRLVVKVEKLKEETNKRNN